MTLLLRYARWRHPHFAARLKERNLVAQIKARDEGTGRWIEIRDGKITSGAGQHPKPDITLSFKNAATGASLLTPPINWLNQINAQKDFTLGVDGPEDLTNWFAQTLMMMQTAHWTFGTPMPDGSMRYCNMTNGGPVFITVKDDKIVRMTPIDFDDSDPQPWTIKARGMNFTPPRKTTLAPHGQNAKSIVYSPEPSALSDEARRLRSQRRAQSAEPRQVGIRAHFAGTRRSTSSPAKSSAASATTGRARSRPRTARTTPGAISATTCPRSTASPTRSA